MGKKKNIGAPKDTGLSDTSSQPAVAAMADPKDDWQHKDNADTLMRAHEIMADPTKMKGAMIHIKKKAKAIRSVKDIQAFHQEKYGAGGDPDLETE